MNKLKYWWLFFIKGKRKAIDFAINQQKLSLNNNNLDWLYWNEKITDETERKHWFAIIIFLFLATLNVLLIKYI